MIRRFALWERYAGRPSLTTFYARPRGEAGQKRAVSAITTSFWMFPPASSLYAPGEGKQVRIARGSWWPFATRPARVSKGHPLPRAIPTALDRARRPPPFFDHELVRRPRHPH